MTLHRRSILLLLLLAGGISTCVAICYAGLLWYVESSLLPAVALKAGIDNFAISVDHLGLTGASLSRLALGDPTRPALSVDSIRINYSPSGLLARRIDRIAANGLVLAVIIQDGKIELDGLDWRKPGTSRPTAGADETAAALPLALPVIIDQLQVSGATLALTRDRRQSRLPFELNITQTLKERSVTGTMQISAGPFRDEASGFNLPEPLSLAGNFTGSVNEAGEWSLNLGIEPAPSGTAKPLACNMAGTRFSAAGPSMRITGAGNKQAGRLRSSTTLKDLRFLLENANLTAPLLDMAGEVEFSPRGRTASANIRLGDAELVSRDPGLTVNKMNVILSFPDLLALPGGPPQLLTFSSATLSNSSFANGEVQFRLEPGSILVEKAGCQWAGGLLYTGPIQIKPGQDDYDLTLFCDRLRLSDMLRQFGIGTAEGEGTLSGRIPLSISRGKVVFGEGFLYSNPGETGALRLADPAALTTAIPLNSPQFAQVDFATEALKDFTYRSIRLDLVTREDELILKLRLDGEPSRPLPFRYDSTIGGFARVDVRTEQGIRQPVLLDVNFRLPLDRILDYSKGIQMFIDKLKQQGAAHEKR